MKYPNRHAQITLRRDSGGLRVSMPSGNSFNLEGADAIVLEAADGTNDIDAILALVQREADAAATRETVFLSLDRLADVGLIETRVAPPAGGGRTTRRDVMRLAGATAGYAVLAPVLSASAEPGDLARTGEEHSKNVRAAEQQMKLEMRELRAAEEDAKQVWRSAEETEKKEWQDVREAERNLNGAEQDLRAAEREQKKYQTKEAEEEVKRAEREYKVAQLQAEKERKQYAVAERLAGEAKEKATQTRVSEEVAKKTNVSETARARRGIGGSAAEQAQKNAAEAALKAGLP